MQPSNIHQSTRGWGSGEVAEKYSQNTNTWANRVWVRKQHFNRQRKNGFNSIQANSFTFLLVTLPGRGKPCAERIETERVLVLYFTVCSCTHVLSVCLRCRLLPDSDTCCAILSIKHMNRSSVGSMHSTALVLTHQTVDVFFLHVFFKLKKKKYSLVQHPHLTWKRCFYLFKPLHMGEDGLHGLHCKARSREQNTPKLIWILFSRNRRKTRTKNTQEPWLSDRTGKKRFPPGKAKIASIPGKHTFEFVCSAQLKGLFITIKGVEMCLAKGDVLWKLRTCI